MKIENNVATDVKIAYIGGGSRGWAWGLMSDLVSAEDISGSVYLYDIDFEAAQKNEIIGNKFNNTTFSHRIMSFMKLCKESLHFICRHIGKKPQAPSIDSHNR